MYPSSSLGATRRGVICLLAGWLAGCGGPTFEPAEAISLLGPWDRLDQGHYAAGTRFDARVAVRPTAAALSEDLDRLEARSTDPEVLGVELARRDEVDDADCPVVCVWLRLEARGVGEARVHLGLPDEPAILDVPISVRAPAALTVEDALLAPLAPHGRVVLDPLPETTRILAGSFPFVFLSLLDAEGELLKGHLPLETTATDPDVLHLVRRIAENPDDESGRRFQLEAAAPGQAALRFLEPRSGAELHLEAELVEPWEADALTVLPALHDDSVVAVRARLSDSAGTPILGGRCTFEAESDGRPLHVPHVDLHGCTASPNPWWDAPLTFRAREEMTALEASWQQF